MNEIKFAKKIREAGGELFLVGGCVRDRLLGKKPNDKDYLLCGISEEDFTRLFPRAVKVGKSFPVYLAYVGAKRCEIAFARTVLTANKNIAVEPGQFISIPFRGRSRRAG